MRAWTKDEIRGAFRNYLQCTRSLDWWGLPVHEREALEEYHLGIIFWELKRFRPKHRLPKTDDNSAKAPDGRRNES